MQPGSNGKLGPGDRKLPTTNNIIIMVAKFVHTATFIAFHKYLLYSVTLYSLLSHHRPSTHGNPLGLGMASLQRYNTVTG
jgi:hypothetical protein